LDATNYFLDIPAQNISKPLVQYLSAIFGCNAINSMVVSAKAASVLAINSIERSSRTTR
jgi:hypothetical protein